MARCQAISEAPLAVFYIGCAVAKYPQAGGEEEVGVESTVLSFEQPSETQSVQAALNRARKESSSTNTKTAAA